VTFDSEELELLYRARLLGTKRGQVLEPWAYPEACRLADKGWLRREFLPNNDVAWFLTPKAAHALDLAQHAQHQHAGRDN
jgi:hypothetical protein